MNFLDMFAGIGGFPLAAYWAGLQAENHYFSEVDPYAISVYQRRFPDGIAAGDCRRIDYASLPSGEWLVCGGFPCQPHSQAGLRLGAEDERDLWPECARALRELRPEVAVFENVPGLFTSDGGRFFNGVLSDIAAAGYDAEWQIISALDVGAPHLRKRIWIVCTLADAGSRRLSRADAGEIQQPRRAETIGASFDVADAPIPRRNEGQREQSREIRDEGRWPEPERRGNALAYPASLGRREGWTESARSGTPLADAPRFQQGREIERPERERIGTGGEPEFATDSQEFGGDGFRETWPTRRKPVRGRDSESGGEETLADPNSHERHGRSRIVQMGWVGLAQENEIDDDPRGTQWKFEPRIRRVLNGVPDRVEQLKSLGNAIVPQVAEVIFNLPFFDRWRVTR